MHYGGQGNIKVMVLLLK